MRLFAMTVMFFLKSGSYLSNVPNHYFSSDSGIDEHGLVFLEFGDLALLQGDGFVYFGRLGFDVGDDGFLFFDWWEKCDQLLEFIPIQPFSKIGNSF